MMRINNIKEFFFFKQKTAKEILALMEVRSVTFRSGDVHPRHPVLVATRRRRCLRGRFLLRTGPLAADGDGYHGAAADVVLDGHRPPHLLRRRACYAETRADAPDPAQRLRRGAGEAELHRPRLVLYPGPLVRDPYDVPVLQHGDHHALVPGVHEVLEHLANRLLGRLPPRRPDLVHHQPGELRRGGARVGGRHLGHLWLPGTRVHSYADADARALRLTSCSLRAYHPHSGI